MKMKSCLLAVLLAAGAAVPAVEIHSGFGVCAHLGWSAEYAKLIEELDLMQAAGIKWARADFTWAQIEPRENEFDFAVYDRVVAEAEKRQVKILPILCYNSKWTKGFAHENLDAWARYVRTLVSRYGDRLKHWEVWNEPNIGFWKPSPNPEQYVSLLKVSYQTIKAVDPALEVLYGGMAGVAPKFLEDTLKLGAGAFYDIMNIHPYCYPATIEQRRSLVEVDELREILRKYNAPERIWITETGWPTHQSEAPIHARFWAEMIVAGAKRRFPGQERWTCAVVVDPAEYAAGGRSTREEIFKALAANPAFTAKAVTWAEAAAITPADTQILVALVGEHFAKNQYDKLLSYVRDGGMLVHIGGVPLYYADEYDAENACWVPARNNAPERYRAGLRIGWSAWWIDKELPEKAEVTTVAGEALNFTIPKKLETTRWFNDKLLKEGDEFVPLLKASDKAGKFIGWPVALYLFNSDYKGAVLTACLPTGHNSGVTWDVQGGRCPRAYLTYLESGIEVFFWYEFRDGGSDPYYNEHHFGMIQLGLEPKPAYNALKYAISLVGDKPQFTGKSINADGVVSIGFKTASGQGMAIWNKFGPDMACSFPAPAAVFKATDHLGAALELKAENGVITLNAGEAPTYILW
ncbi:MAG: family 1 glycosylhydrolase [Lentisphaerae bacterium]|nr:family 1 glycosylhydrolase [Lentisphaerota bacterium]